jgi:3-phenylpropionate/cinnamic acid dioxygenase small subunit
MSDADEIRNLLGRYCEVIDAGDWEAVGALFAHGALAAEDGTVLAAGAEAVAAFYRSGTRLHDGSPRTKHLVTNTILESAAPDGSVTARSSYLVLQATEGFALQPIITGRYVDRFAVDADAERRWHFVERRFAGDRVGDLSHHLTWDL